MVYGQDLRTISLKDGSKIQGKIVSFANNIYTIESPVFGSLNLKEEDILSISSQELAPQAIDPQQIKNQMSQMQSKLLTDPAIASDIANIAQDKEILEMLQDPTLLEAVKNFDPQAVQNNPTIQKLMQNEKMKNLMNKAGQKLGYPTQTTNSVQPVTPTQLPSYGTTVTIPRTKSSTSTSK